MSKALKLFITSLIIIIVVGAGTSGAVIYYLSKNQAGSEKELSIDEMNEFSYETPEITTDLTDGRFVRVQFRIVTDGKDGLKELEKRDFQIKNILIKEISEMNEEDFSTGLKNVENTLQTSLNELMTEGKILEVYTIGKILQ